MHWYGPDKHYWFRADVAVPQEMDGKPLWMHVCTQIDEWDDAKNPQFLLFVDGKVTQGVDMNHRDILLDRCAKGGQKYRLELQSYTGILHTEFNLIVDLREIDPEIEGLYYDMVVPLEAFPRLEEDGKARRDLENVLNEAVNLIDLRTPYNESFYQSIAAARRYLAKALYTDLAGHEEVIASCIGHTHIDVAWWWTVAQTREKVCRSFATVLKLMDEYPNYKFMSSQPQLYYFLKQRYPELYEQIKQRVAEGRWEPEGGMWVEADCNLTSGESLVRQFLYGKRFFKDEFGVDNKIMWLPDVFGYSAALPQIMKKAGIDYFMTTKISWNEFNKVPYDTFMWKGIDGTEILSHFSPSTDCFDEGDCWQTTYNAYLNPEHILGGWHRYSQKDLNKEYLCTFGHGDGGGGPTRDMLEMGHRMAKGIPGCPKVKQEFAIDFYHDLEKEVKGSRRLPKWAGELYLEFHRGTLTSQGRNKRYNRKSELLYHDMETICAIADSNGIASYPRQFINDGWKIILLNQFHDIIPGSSIKEVYEDSKEQYDKLISEGKAEIADTLGKIVCTPDGSALTVFNTFGAERDDVVITDMPAAEHFSIVDADGNVMPWQKSADGRLVFFAKGVPAKGYKTFSIVHGGESGENTVKVENKTIENKFFTVKFDKDMNIASLIHKATGRAVAPEGEVLNKIYAYDDRPFNHEAWDIKVYFDQKYTEINDVSAVDVTESGPVRTVIKVTRKFLSSTIDQSFIFYADLPRIDVDYTVDWKEKKILLKADFPVDVNATEATYDIQFGNYKRPTHRNTLWDFAQFEVVGHKWVDLSDNSFGLSVLNDCKYGHDIKDGHIRTSLLRCAVNPNSEQDREVHRFTYSIYPHAGSVDTSDVVNQGYSLNLPLYCVTTATRS